MESFEKIGRIEILYDAFTRGVVGGLVSLVTLAVLGLLLSTSVRVPATFEESIFVILFTAGGIYLFFKPVPIVGIRDVAVYFTAMLSGYAAISACLMLISLFLPGVLNYAIAVAMVGGGLSLGRFVKTIAKGGE